MTLLTHQSCTPCQGGVPPLEKARIELLLSQLQKEWRINLQGHLCRDYVFPDFIQALHFVNTVGQIAEKEAHHPDFRLGWGYCGIEIWTHKINGLTESDFILAAKIDRCTKENT